MDYEIKATNRKQLRLFAQFFRLICGLGQDEVVDPVLLLDRLADIDGFSDVEYEIVYGNELPGDVPARCIEIEGGWLIQIKETTYKRAAENKNGANYIKIK